MSIGQSGEYCKDLRLERRRVLRHAGMTQSDWNDLGLTEAIRQGKLDARAHHSSLPNEGSCGIDSLNIDDIADLTRPVHSILLAAEIPIVEHLRGLGQLSDAPFRFFAVPVKVKGMGNFPVRAFGLVEETACCVNYTG
jgi:hypothetical protein